MAESSKSDTTASMTSDVPTSTLYSSSSQDDSLMLSGNTSSTSDNTIDAIKINRKHEMLVKCIETKEKKSNRYSSVRKIDSRFLTKAKIGAKRVSSLDQVKAKGMPLNNIRLDKKLKSMEQKLKVRVFVDQPNKNKSI